MVELSLLFKLDFYPFFSFVEKDKIYFVGNRIEAYNLNKKIYTYKLKSQFKNACKISKILYILTDEEIIKYDYLKNKVMLSIKGNFDNIACKNNRIIVSNLHKTIILDTNLVEVFQMDGKFKIINEFITNSDTISKKILVISVGNFDSLIIRNFEGFVPYFGKYDSLYYIIAGFSKRNFYIYLFENKVLRWYNKISTKVIISDIILNLKDRTILIYGQSQRTFYVNLKDLMGEDIWVYNPRVLGIYYLYETIRDAFIDNGKIFSCGYSIREDEKRGVIKVFNYIDGSLIYDHFDSEIEDFIKIFKINENYYAIGITKKFIGFYKLDFKSKISDN